MLIIQVSPKAPEGRMPVMSTNEPAASDHTLSVPEAAERLGISRNLAYAAAARGDIPAIRLGRKTLRVLRRPLERMLDPDKAA
jgi:excisionase family DNA binding protein